MFLGHYAVALGAKRAAPALSLGTLFAAAAFLDLLWPVLVLMGIERVDILPGATAFTPLDFEYYPFSHSLGMSVAWGGALGLGYFALRREPAAAVVLGLVVISHWVLDAVTHRPDLPLTLNNEPVVGLGLWNSIPGTLIVELSMFALGIVLYSRTTRALDAVGRWSLVAFVIFLLLIYAGAAFGPLPPNAQAIAWSGLAQWLVIAWAAWIDRHRTPAAPLRG